MNRSVKLMEIGDISDEKALKFLSKYIKSEETTFQHLINIVITGLNGCNTYINDVVIYSDTTGNNVLDM